MKGTHRIIVQNKKIKYDFEVKRNITVIRGDSATGKTALVDMIREFYENGSGSGIDLYCDKTCAVLEGKNWKVQLTAIEDSIVFIDEGNAFVSSKDFASAIQNTDNYYVIVTRESLETLPYSVEEIYGIRNSGKYGYLKQTYNEFYHIYRATDYSGEIKPDKIITEDSQAGFQFFRNLCEENEIICESANGKSNIFSKISEPTSGKILIIADGAAFGSQIGKVMQLVKQQDRIVLYLPESFEWMILCSGLLNDQEVDHMIDEPSEYIESSLYMSWERYFTHLLIQKTENIYLQYSKNSLNPAYLQKAVYRKILNVMKNIKLS